MRKLIAIDFDDVICENVGYNNGECLGEEKEGAIQAIIELHEAAGYIPYIFTTRADSERNIQNIRDWFIKRNPRVDLFYSILITNAKQPKTLLYLDDRAYRFTSWYDFKKYFI